MFAASIASASLLTIELLKCQESHVVIDNSKSEKHASSINQTKQQDKYICIFTYR